MPERQLRRRRHVPGDRARRGLRRAIGEVARVLEPGRKFLLLLNHPLLQAPGSGWIDDHILEEQYWRVGQYLNDDTASRKSRPASTCPSCIAPSADTYT